MSSHSLLKFKNNPTKILAIVILAIDLPFGGQCLSLRVTVTSSIYSEFGVTNSVTNGVTNSDINQLSY